MVLALVGVFFLLPSGDDCPTQVRFPPANRKHVTIDQGVWGNVWFWRGDFMPECIHGTIRAVSREIRIYELTRDDQVTATDRPAFTFFSEVKSKLLATTRSDSRGFFQVRLAPGKYSIFVLERGLFYSNSLDNDLNIGSFEVVAGAPTKLQFDITYEKTA